MPTIFVKNLIIQASHGVMEQERKVGNTFRVNITLEVPDASRAMSTDDLADTVSYADTVAIVRRSMSRPRALIEAAAGDIVRAIKTAYGPRIRGGSITIEKLAPPIPAQLESVGFSTDF